MEIRMSVGNDSKKFLFICETPLQVLNACRFVLSDVEGSAHQSDICIFHLFRSAAEISDRLKSLTVFNRVIEIAAFPAYRGFHGKISTLYRMLMPKHTLKKYAKTEQDNIFLKETYSHIVLCHTTPTARAVRQCFPKAEFLLMEDGTGSYVGNILEDQKSGMLRTVERVFPAMEKLFLPKAQFLSNKDMYIGEMEAPVFQLSLLSEEETVQTLDAIFAYEKNTFYKEADAVFLSQPLEYLGSMADQTDEAVQNLMQSVFTEKAVMRVHPRHVGVHSLLPKDEWGNLWEIECMRQIASRHILVAYYSTAQFMPKILKNEEPVLVFLYKIYREKQDSVSDRFEKFIEEFRKSYANPERIVTPENLQELADILKYWKGKRNEL